MLGALAAGCESFVAYVLIAGAVGSSCNRPCNQAIVIVSPEMTLLASSKSSNVLRPAWQLILCAESS